MGIEEFEEVGRLIFCFRSRTLLDCFGLHLRMGTHLADDIRNVLSATRIANPTSRLVKIMSSTNATRLFRYH